MSDTPTAGAETPRILDAASILLLDQTGSQPRLLMGLRRADNVFLPNKWVFPGGRLEHDDSAMRPSSPIDAADEAALLHGLAHDPVSGPAFAAALALAAVRELFEETGHALAVREGEGDDLDGVWPAFRALRLRPALAPLRLLARAVTPPGRPRRYDTRFFLAPRQAVLENAASADGEFTDLNWFTFGEAQALDLPNITRRILTDLELGLSPSGGSAGGPAGGPGFGPVPFYYQEGEHFRRDLIPRGGGRPAA
ncbi:MAG: NUDIX hydrolase [Hyphomicrobium sp.]